MTIQLSELIESLLSPGAYPETPQHVEIVQTQMSVLFLTDKYVYKVKKPVNFGFLDYTTLDKRLYFCQQEIVLNRRLCPDAYLDVVSIVRHNGNILIDRDGEALEYAVKMLRLPKDRMMDVLLSSNQISPEMISRVAQKVSDFHSKAETNPAISKFGNLDTIIQNTKENFNQTEKYLGKTISPENYNRIKSYTESFIENKASLFHKRVTGGRIRDCHGDLHAAHICFIDGICIYDCIEFNERFRYSDVAAEVAFLAMDLDHYGKADLSRSFVKEYLASSKDTDIKELLGFYKCYRAYVRGKVGSFKLDDPHISEEEKKETLNIVRSYFDLAGAYTRTRPVLIITTGLVGTGKSTLANALAKRLGMVVLSSDITRKTLAGILATEHRLEEFNKGIYSTDFSRATYDKMFAEAKEILADGDSAIIDASFINIEERLEAKQLAEKADADFFIIEFTLDEESAKKRLEQRFKQASVSDGRWEIYEPQKKKFKPVTEVPPSNHLVINTSQPLEENVRLVVEKLN